MSRFLLNFVNVIWCCLVNEEIKKEQELMARKEELFTEIKEKLCKAKAMCEYLTKPYNQACFELLCNTVGIISGTKFKE